MRTLAKYDFRSKQQYIYRTNKVKEIVGASELITCAYNNFFNALWAEGIRVDNGIAVEGKCPADKPCAFEEGASLRYINNPELGFDPEFDENVDGKIVDGKIIYIGGGNLCMLWVDKTTAERASGVLCKMLREQTYSLSAVCGMAEYKGNYSKDMKALNDNFEACKVEVPPFMPCAILPFTKLDRSTSLPIAHETGERGMAPFLKEKESISEESLLKRKQYHKTHTEIELLDDIVTQKGVESLLAVIYIDGNNMGQRVINEMNPQGEPITDYVTGVRTIRKLSNDIQDCFVTRTRAAIDAAAASDELMKDKIRWIVSGGDEITLICNARAALKIVDIYFSTLAETSKDQNVPNTACAGIAIFHSHFPFSEAYSIAEECCENAKKTNRRNGSNNCLVDFQYIFSGVTGSLDDIREIDGCFMSRPYLVAAEDSASALPHLKEDFAERTKRLKCIGRSNIKLLSSLLFQSEEKYRFELARLNAQYPEARLKENYASDRRFILDISQFYDIWFAEEVR